MTKTNQNPNEARSLPTTERLARAIEAEAHIHNDTRPCIKLMIDRARLGYYDDFKSDLAYPITQLVNDFRSIRYFSMARRAENGEFDATMEESMAWMEREGKFLLCEDPR